MENNSKQVKNILTIILVANIIVALLKIIIGKFIESASMMADGFHSLSDGASNIVGIISIGIAMMPRDKEHPYGHSKFEIIGSMVIGIILAIVSIKIISDSIYRFSNMIEPSISIDSLIILILTLIINILVCRYEEKMGKKLNSHILVSDSIHTKSDIFISIGVLLTLIGIKLGLPSIIDPLVSIIVAIFIIHSSYEILKSSMDILVDKAIVDENCIIEIVGEFKEVKGIHHIRSRGSESDIHIDMHILVDCDLTIEKAHNLNHDIEKKIQSIISHNCQVIVHIEPYYDSI